MQLASYISGSAYGVGKGGDERAWSVHVICSGVWVYIYLDFSLHLACCHEQLEWQVHSNCTHGTEKEGQEEGQ